MGQSGHPASKSATSHLHAMNLVVALLAGVISIAGGIYSLKNNIFSGPTFGSLEGIVRDERIAKPLRLVLVEVSDLAGAVVNSAATDDDGHYLIETLRTGNYAVKFAAPIHKAEIKTVKIEKNLKSVINVDLLPEAQTTFPISAETAVLTQPHTSSRAAYPATVSTASGDNVSGNTAMSPGVPSTYSPPQPVQNPSFFGPPRPGHRRHSHPSYSGNSGAVSPDMSPSNSQSDVLTQAGTQLLEAWMNKKSEDSTTALSN